MIAFMLFIFQLTQIKSFGSSLFWRLRPILACAVLVLAAMACMLSATGPLPPGPTLAPDEASDDTACGVERKLREAGALASRGSPATLSLTQAEVTAWLARRAEEYAAHAREPLPLAHLQVYFDAGAAHFYAEHRAGAIVSRVLVTVTPAVTAGGQLDVDISAAQYGPVPLDAALSFANGVVDDALAALGERYRVHALSLDGGTLTVSFEIFP
jgi:hypothetical protein